MRTRFEVRSIMKTKFSARRGFSLIELLVVIAIIAILAALLFPVFASVREQTRQTQCMQQMHDIATALKLYEVDNNKYPATLLGFTQIHVQDAATGTDKPEFYTGPGQVGAVGQPLPPLKLAYKPMLGLKTFRDPNEFACPDSPNKDQAAITTAIYPATAGAALAGRKAIFTPLIGHNTGAENDPYFQQNIAGMQPDGSYSLNSPLWFYAYDAYDIGPQLDSQGNVMLDNTGKPVVEVHYSLDWTGQRGPNDPSNQLKYGHALAPSNTVVTWCSYHQSANHAGKVLVLLLDGNTKAVDAKTFAAQGPLGYGR